MVKNCTLSHFCFGFPRKTRDLPQMISTQPRTSKTVPLQSARSWTNTPLESILMAPGTLGGRPVSRVKRFK
jgi:hypothetical protein